MSRGVRLLHRLCVSFLTAWSPSGPEWWLLDHATLHARGGDGDAEVATVLASR